MTELTGREAKTIHRLLEVEWGDGDNRQFSRNEKNPLSCEVIIIDEASMIDALLFDSLLKALRLSCRIILAEHRRGQCFGGYFSVGYVSVNKT